MRRSAAPSFKSSAKRLRFLSEFSKDNDLLNYMEPEIAKNFNSSETDMSSTSENKINIPTMTPEDNMGGCLRSTSDILQLISDSSIVRHSDSNLLVTEFNSDSIIHCHNNDASKTSLPQTICNEENKVSENNYNSSIKSSKSCYNVLWCKRSSKKHKKWEGDGILVIRDRTAILKNSEGKEIDRGIGYKLKDISVLEEGSKFYIGNKECEIQDLISSENCDDNETIQLKKPLQSLKGPSLIHKNSSHKQLCM